MSLLSVVAVAARDAAAIAEVCTRLDPRLRLIAHTDVVLVACEGDEQAPDPRNFVRWIQQLHARFDVMPMRFGEDLGNEAQAMEILERRAPQVLFAIDAIVGRTEFGARLMIDVARADSEPMKSGEGSPRGRAYLYQRSAHYAAIDGIPAGLTNRVERLTHLMDMPQLKTRLDGPTKVSPYPCLSFLVERSAAAMLAARFEEHREILGCPSVLTGPWAPFNFVRECVAAG